MIAAAKQLKVIGRHCVGVDNIDVKAATKKGIVVVYTPNATSAAEHTLKAIGALAKRAVAYDRATPVCSQPGGFRALNHSMAP